MGTQNSNFQFRFSAVCPRHTWENGILNLYFRFWFFYYNENEIGTFVCVSKLELPYWFFFPTTLKRNWNFPWLRTTELQLLFPMRVHSCTLVPTVFLRHEKTAFKFNGIQTYFFRFPSTLKTKLELLLSFFVNPLICTTELQLSFPFFIICFHVALKNEICTSSFVSCFCVLLW